MKGWVNALGEAKEELNYPEQLINQPEVGKTHH